MVMDASTNVDRAVVPTGSSQQAVSPVPASIPSAWDPVAANLHWRRETYARTMRNALSSVPDYMRANPGMNEDDAFLSGVHGELMDIIEKLFGTDDGAPMECPSDTAFEVMAALGFHVAQAIEARMAISGTGIIQESAVAKP